MPEKNGLDALLELRAENNLDRALIVSGAGESMGLKEIISSGIHFLQSIIDILRLKIRFEDYFPNISLSNFFKAISG
jgi:response regulator of citrate/malate metabolism